MALTDILVEEQLDKVVEETNTALNNRPSYDEADNKSVAEQAQARDNTNSEIKAQTIGFADFLAAADLLATTPYTPGDRFNVIHAQGDNEMVVIGADGLPDYADPVSYRRVQTRSEGNKRTARFNMGAAPHPFDFASELETWETRFGAVQVRYFDEIYDGGGGFWLWDGADNTAAIAADPLGIVRRPANTASDGSLGTWVRQDLFRGAINAGWAGIIADGNGNGAGTDQAPKIQACIDLAVHYGHEKVIIPYIEGFIRLGSVIEMTSNVHVISDPRNKFDCELTADNDVISMKGIGLSNLTFMATAVTRGDNLITALGDRPFAVGDILHLTSQRDSLSVDAGDWQLGDGTTGSNKALFHEFHVVNKVVDSKNWEFVDRIIFPDYNLTAASETDPDAEVRTVVHKVNPIVNSVWEGGTFYRETGNRFHVSEWAYDCHVKNIKVIRGGAFGSTIDWRLSYKCEAYNVDDEGDAGLQWDYATMHGNLNRFKVIGSQDCGFDKCSSKFSAQPVDFTFGNGDLALCNIRPYFRNGTLDSCFEGATSHAGSYREEWVNNKILNCFRTGLTIRGLQPIIHGNTITSASEDIDDFTNFFSEAITFLGGHTRGLSVRRNDVSGFRRACRFQDGADAAERFGRINGIIAENTITNCRYGLDAFISVLGASNALRGLIYRDNHHYRMHKAVVKLPRYFAGVVIEGNTLTGAMLAPGGVSFLDVPDGDCPALTFKNNTWIREASDNAAQNRHLYNIQEITDTTAFPAATWANQTEISGNRVLFDGGILTVKDDTTYVQ